MTVWLTHSRWERCECQSWASPSADPRAFRQLLGAPQGCARPPCVTCGQAHTRASARAPPDQPHPPSPWGLGARQLPALPLPTPCWGPGLFPVRLRPVVSGCRSQEAVGPGVGGAQRACWGHPSRARGPSLFSLALCSLRGLQPASPVQTDSLEPRAWGSSPEWGTGRTEETWRAKAGVLEEGDHGAQGRTGLTCGVPSAGSGTLTLRVGPRGQA